MQIEKIRHTVGRVTLIAALAAILLSVFLSFSATAIDLSRPGSSGETYNNIKDGSWLLEDALGLEISDEERAYLRENGEFKLIYPKNIPTSYVSMEHSGTTVTVTARVYAHTLADGTVINSVPRSARERNGSEVYNFPELPNTAGEYVLTLTLPDVTDEFGLDISYYINVTVPKNEVNSTLSKAYYDAEYLVYLLDMLEYEAALAEYNTYIKEKKVYEELSAKRQNYLDELEKYNTDTALYEKYLVELEKYNADYLLYLESEKKAETLADEIAAYNAYVLKMDTISYRLSLMEQMKRPHTELKRTLYDAIYGTAVDQVLENESLLVTGLGVSQETVSLAGRSTKTLRRVLSGYFELETDEDKYIYYISYYNFIAPHFAKLFAALDDLYSNEKVRSTLVKEDKDEKFDILLSQLYYASHAFSDGPVYKMDGVTAYTSSYKIKTAAGYKTPIEILGDADYYKIKYTSKPAENDVYPQEVVKPDYTPVPQPVRPTEVKEPTAPDFVAEPTPPAEVSEPQRPEEKDGNGLTVTAPFEADSVYASLVSAYREGKLSERDELYLAQDLSVDLDITVTKQLNAASVTVSYHDVLGNHIGDVSLDAGGFAEILYTPEKAETDKVIYSFDYWVDGEGNQIDLSSISTDIRVYPHFKETLKTCDITWVIDGNVTVTKVPYDMIPECPVIPEKVGDVSVYYSFVSWDKSPVPVSSDASYTAVFEKHYMIPELPSDGAVSLVGDTVTVDAKAAERIDISRLAALAAGNYALQISFKEAVVALSYSDLISFTGHNPEYIEWSSSSDTFSLVAYGSDGAAIADGLSFNVTLTSHTPSASTRLIAERGGERSYVRYEHQGGMTSFVLNTGYTYRFRDEYSVAVFPQDTVSISASLASAAAGEYVSVSHSLPNGYRLLSLYYVGSDGVKHRIEDGGFAMPEYDVGVMAEFEKISYSVSFVAGGTVISTVHYHLGDAVRVPKAPEGFDDGEFIYHFFAWDKTVTRVTGDATYTAVYERLPMEKDTGGIKISPSLLRLVVTGGLIALVFVLGVLPSGAVFIIIIVKRKKSGILLSKLFKIS